MDSARGEMTPTERAAFIAWRLYAGDVWTTAEVAALLGMTWNGADALLNRAAIILPIYRDDDNRWRKMDEGEINDAYAALLRLWAAMLKIRGN